MKSNPWIARYQLADKDLDAFAGIECRASPLALAGTTPVAEAETLKSGLRKVYLCSEQTRVVIRELMSIAHSHAQSHFASPQAWVTGLYSTHPWGTEMPPAVMLTGLAGVGKTELILALQRLLGGPVTTQLPGHQQVPLVAAWFMTLRDGAGLNTLVRPWLDAATRATQEPDVPDHQQKKLKQLNLSKLLALARRVSRRDGVCLAVADEFQFITQSAQANALATTVLLQLMGIGPRLVYVANYSLARRLMARRQEDRQRLLVHPIHLRPEPLTGLDWTELLTEYIRLAPDDFQFSGAQAAELVHQYTYGIKRSAVELLGSAWLNAKVKRGRRALVTLDDIRSAYLSASFSIYREDVESLWKLGFGALEQREDLRDPFATPGSNETVTEATKLILGFEQKVEARYLDSFLTPEERKAVKALEGGHKSGQSKGQVVRLPQGKISKQSLLETSRKLDEMQTS